MEEQEHRNILPEGFLLQEYKIESVLGKPGGFGITYKATDTNLKQSVAVKEYLPTEFAIREGRSSVCIRSKSDKEAFDWGLKCFTEEAQVLARFRHPNIVQVLRFFRENGTAYMVMGYQEGENLAEYLKRFKILSEEDLLTIILPLLGGLEAIHQAKLLHRDIKPNNIYIRKDKTPVLLDFGSARYAIGEKSHTVTSIVSPGYAPLEQYDNDIGEQGPWTDIYALGAVMYCAITGEPPPASTRRALKDEYSAISATKKGKGKYQEHLLSAIDWALQLNREDRPQSIEAWRQELALVTLPNQAVTSPIARRIPPRLSEARRSLWTSIGILVFLLFTTATGLLIYQYTELTNEREARIRLEGQLREEQKNYIELEKIHEQARTELESAKGTIKKIKFLGETEQTQDGKTELINKYHGVIIPNDDTLNVRVRPGAREDKLGEIPPKAICIIYLDEYQIVNDGPKENIWVKIRYHNKKTGQSVEGWVNSYYLGSLDRKTCETDESNNDQEKSNGDQENTKTD